MEIMRLAAYFRIWNVDEWLRSITWDQLETWLEFMRREPHGEERDDLRIGALATVVLNTADIDHKAIGGMIKPKGYIAGWSRDLKYTMTSIPPELEAEIEKGASGGGNSGSASGKINLNDPVGWENFTTGLQKLAKVKGQ